MYPSPKAIFKIKVGVVQSPDYCQPSDDRYKAERYPPHTFTTARRIVHTEAAKRRRLLLCQ